jgi:hypothetical protein
LGEFLGIKKVRINKRTIPKPAVMVRLIYEYEDLVGKKNVIKHINEVQKWIGIKLDCQLKVRWDDPL